MLMVAGSDEIDGIKVEWYWEEDAAKLHKHAADHVLAGTSFVKYADSVGAQLSFHYLIATKGTAEAEVTTCVNFSVTSP